MEFIAAAKVSEAHLGKMKRVELSEKEIMIAREGGRFYAVGDRCGYGTHSAHWGNYRGTP